MSQDYCYYSGMCTHLVNFIFIAVYISLLSPCAAAVNLLNNEELVSDHDDDQCVLGYSELYPVTKL